MAAYKKDKSDVIIKYIVIGFTVMFFGLLATLIGYNLVNEELEYTQFDHIDNYALIASMPEEEYAVYYYSENCSYCKQIKSQVLGFADENNMDLPVYFIDTASVSGTNPIQQVTGTPSLVVFVNGQVYDFVAGAVDIPQLIDEVNAGEYTFQ